MKRMRYLAFLFACGVLLFGSYAASEVKPEKLYRERLRPQFHFTARYWDHYKLHPGIGEEGWINDVNGLAYNDGVYHLFAQRWSVAWLHAVSTDLIHWKELRPAFGQGGRFGDTQSGGCVVDVNNCSGLGDGKVPPMIAFWSSGDNLNQCISYSLDRGMTWTKYAKNPVLVHKYRDPNVFWYAPDKKWVMVLYGPPDGAHAPSPLRYGFNGQNNDAHYVRDVKADTWMCSAIRMFDNGRIVVTDQDGQSETQIVAGLENIGTDGFWVGCKSDGSEFLNGDIAEILIYDRTLSDGEAQHIIASLQSKWGMSSSIAKRAVLDEGLVLRLDPANATVAADGKVSRWKDTSGHHNDMIQTIANRMPERITNGLNAHPVMRFKGSEFLRGPAVLSGGDDTFTMIAVWRRKTVEEPQVICEQNMEKPETGRRACFLTSPGGQRERPNYVFFSSTNLLDWKKLDGYLPGFGECPDMFELPVDNDSKQKKWVVVNGNGDYVVGSFDGNRFTTEVARQKGDYGNNFYATQTYHNMPRSDARCIQMAWMRGEYPADMPFNQQLTFPCTLTLHKSSRGIVLCRYPVHEIGKIHGEEVSLRNKVLQPGENPLSGLDGDLLDVNFVCDISNSTCSAITLQLRGNVVKYDVNNNNTLWSVGSQAPLKPKAGLVEIRVLMDRLSVETFGNQGEVSMTNVACQKDTTPRLELSATGGKAQIVSLSVHKLKSSWK